MHFLQIGAKEIMAPSSSCQLAAPHEQERRAGRGGRNDGCGERRDQDTEATVLEVLLGEIGDTWGHEKGGGNMKSCRMKIERSWGR